MQVFFETPQMFWHGFVLSFLTYTAAGAAVQCWFLINFCGIKSRASYYIIYICISYAQYLTGLFANIPVSPMLDTLIGAGILFIFINKLLKQNGILSAITAALTMAVTALVESTLFLLDNLTFQVLSAAITVSIVGGLLFSLLSLAIFKFFVDRYSVKSRYQSRYLLAFSLPVFFISVVLRTANYIRYAVTTDGIILQSDKIQNHEMIILTVIAFLCVCTVLFAYEKTVKQVESENQKALLRAQIAAQESYVAEAKQKYETTKAFRHDFRNHIVALRGLINCGDIKKAAGYMDRFEQTYQDITFHVDTGNSIVDTLLGEKLSYAEQAGIHIKCDITVPQTVKIDDFDLCTIFANAIDNAIKACNSIKDGERTIDIVAKANKDFFVIDMMNNYREGGVPKGSGIGLPTIQIISEKYHGAVEISDGGGSFRISIILPFCVHA